MMFLPNWALLYYLMSKLIHGISSSSYLRPSVRAFVQKSIPSVRAFVQKSIPSVRAFVQKSIPSVQKSISIGHVILGWSWYFLHHGKSLYVFISVYHSDITKIPSSLPPYNPAVNTNNPKTLLNISCFIISLNLKVWLKVVR